MILLRDDKLYKFNGNRGKEELMEFAESKYEELASEIGNLPTSGSGMSAITKPIYRFFAKLGMDNV